MNKSLLIPLVLLTSSICFGSLNGIAAEPCANPPDTVKQSPPQNAAAIKHHFWDIGRDKGSNEQLKTLHLFFKNGDYAVIQHKYCTVYNFSIAYFRSGQGEDFNKADIAKIVNSLYESYAAKKVTFKRPLPEIISTLLKEQGFDDEKDIDVGLPMGSAGYPNEHVGSSLGYKSLYRTTSVYSSMATFYVGIGGLD